MASLEGLPEVHERKMMGESKRKQEVYPVTRKFGLVAAICTAPIFIVFAYCGDPDRGFTAWLSSLVILVAIRMFWGLKKRAWFWITITIIALLHAILVFCVPWPFKQVSYVALLPVALPDLAIVYGIIRLVERFSRC